MVASGVSAVLLIPRVRPQNEIGPQPLRRGSLPGHRTPPGSPLPQPLTARLGFPGHHGRGLTRLLLFPPAARAWTASAGFLCVCARHLEVTVSSLCLARPPRWDGAGTHPCAPALTAPPWVARGRWRGYIHVHTANVVYRI